MVLALYSFGVILAHRCGLNSVAAVLVPLLGLQFSTVRSRLQEFYQPAQAKSDRDHRRQLDVTTCFAPLLAWILKGWPSTRLAVALDATSMGDVFTVLSISVVYRGSAIPVAWKIMPANVRHAWKPEWIALLKRFSQSVEPGWTVIVMTDRGLYARWLYQEILALGWHPLMRINHRSTFRKAGSRRAIPVTALVPKIGRRWQGRGMAFPKRAHRRLECTLLACWEAGHDQAWFLVTDLDPQVERRAWYGMRSWIENGFRLLKSEGWNWQRTRMTDPERAERLWLVLAVATRYVLGRRRRSGGERDAHGDDPGPGVPGDQVPCHRSACIPRAGREAATTGCDGDGSECGPHPACLGDEGARGQRFPPRIGPAARPADYDSYAAENLNGNWNPGWNSEDKIRHRPNNHPRRSRKPPPSEGSTRSRMSPLATSSEAHLLWSVGVGRNGVTKSVP